MKTIQLILSLEALLLDVQVNHENKSYAMLFSSRLVNLVQACISSSDKDSRFCLIIIDEVRFKGVF